LFFCPTFGVQFKAGDEAQSAKSLQTGLKINQSAEGATDIISAVLTGLGL
jgi:hypothetical protein